MIRKSEKSLRRYCKRYTEIENYDQAIESPESYVIHHKKGIELNLSKDELKKAGLYWHRDPSELIFLTKKEHRQIHTIGERNPSYGKGTFSGHKHSEETIQKMKSHKKSEETKRKMSESRKKWWENKKCQRE